MDAGTDELSYKDSLVSVKTQVLTFLAAVLVVVLVKLVVVICHCVPSSPVAMVIK